MDYAKELLEKLPGAAKLIPYEQMDPWEIDNEIGRGRLPVWIDDKRSTPMSEEYMLTHFLKYVDSKEEFDELCKSLALMERNLHGKTTTRYKCRSPGATLTFYETPVLISDLTGEEADLLNQEIESRIVTSYKGLPPPEPEV